MFGNKNFYPTPDWLIKEMLLGVDFAAVNNILEPSAGKGDIVDYLENQRKYQCYNKFYDIDCIEFDNELQATLKGKKYKVIHNDFLNFHTYKQYDLIIMNPPFDNGEKHLLKALDLQKNGGAIICLLNAETLRNAYSNERKDLLNKLNEYNATIKYIENAFINAERKTDVEIALIKVLIPKDEKECCFLNDLRKKEEFVSFSGNSNELTQFTEQNNFIDGIVEQYELEVRLGIKLIEEFEKMKPYIKQEICKEGEKQYYGAGPILKLSINDYENNDKFATVNEFVKKVRYKYWNALFDNKNFTKNLTSNLIQDLHKQIDKLKDYDFSIYNIMTIKQDLIQNTIKGVEDTILKLFDEFTFKHSYYPECDKNIHYYNGWTTNKAFKINKKIILPSMNIYSWSGRLDYLWTIGEKFKDILQVFNYLATENKQEIDVENVFKINQELNNTKDIDFGYFTATFYRKGTCHIIFKDMELLDKFNLFGSQKKGFLPPNFGKKRYKDMSTKEKEVAQEFCGNEKEYNKIFDNQKYYLVESSNLLMLENKGDK